MKSLAAMKTSDSHGREAAASAEWPQGSPAGWSGTALLRLGMQLGRQHWRGDLALAAVPGAVGALSFMALDRAAPSSVMWRMWLGGAIFAFSCLLVQLVVMRRTWREAVERHQLDRREEFVALLSRLPAALLTLGAGAGVLWLGLGTFIGLGTLLALPAQGTPAGSPSPLGLEVSLLLVAGLLIPAIRAGAMALPAALLDAESPLGAFRLSWRIFRRPGVAREGLALFLGAAVLQLGVPFVLITSVARAGGIASEVRNLLALVLVPALALFMGWVAIQATVAWTIVYGRERARKGDAGQVAPGRGGLLDLIALGLLALLMASVLVAPEAYRVERQGSFRRACQANQKTLAGATEMLCVDRGLTLPIPMAFRQDWVQENLISEGYLASWVSDPGEEWPSVDHYVLVSADRVGCLVHGWEQEFQGSFASSPRQGARAQLEVAGLEDPVLLASSRDAADLQRYHFRLKADPWLSASGAALLFTPFQSWLVALAGLQAVR